MSIPLTTASFLIQDLSQSEKHILTILCFRADKHHEAYSSIKRLCLDCSCCKNTIARGLKVLRDKGYLVYTGKLAPNSRSIPIYSIQLKHKDQLNNREQSTDTQIGYSQNPRVPNLDSTSTQFGFLRIPNLGTRIDNRVLKTIKKDICFFPEPTQQEKNDVAYYLKSDHEMPDELQPIYLWLTEKGLI